MAISYPADGNALCLQLEDGSFWFQHRNRCILAAVGRYPPAGKIVDVGGGNGFVARSLIDAGYPTMVVEPGEDGARNARTHRGIREVVNATLGTAGLQPGSIHAAGLFDVVEHIEDDSAFLSELASMLAPAGMAYITVPAHRWLWSAADVEAGHFRRYTIGLMRARLGEQGFDVLYASYFFEWLVLPLFLMRTLPYAAGARGRRDAVRYQREHASTGGRLSRALQSLFSREVSVISRGGTMWTGTSCLVVARKRA